MDLQWKTLYLASFLILNGCGGSSGQSPDNTGNTPPAGSSTETETETETELGSAVGEIPSVTTLSDSIEITVEDSDEKTVNIPVTFSNLPDTGVHTSVKLSNSAKAISYLDFQKLSDTEGRVAVNVMSAAQLGKETFTNEIILSACLDEACEKHIDGSPLKIATKIISHGLAGSVSMPNTTFLASGNYLESFSRPSAIGKIEFTDVSWDSVHLSLKESEYYSSSYVWLGDTSEGPVVNVDFGYVDGKELGRHVQKYTLSACFDYDCTWHLEGSPLEIEVIYEITMFPDSIEEVEADTRIENDYNIVDAEYSDKLDVVVIASSEPDNALYVYDLADKTEHKIPLNVTPTSVSVANAGNSNKVAVGHDAYVTWVELKEDALSQSSSKMLTATTDIFDLTATEDAVYAVSDNYSWEGLHRIDVMDNSTTVSNSSGQSRIKLHPGLKSVYLTDNGSSSYGLEKVDITSVPPSVSADSPYYGDYPVCGDLWISNKGDRIYTACGNTFRSSDDISVDMTYSGRISTTQIDDYGVARIQSLAESPSSNEIVLIEDGAMYGDSCNAEYYLSGRCFYFLGLYTKDYMNNVERLGFTGNEVEGVSYYDKPEFVFYDESGEDIVVIGNIIGSETPKSAIRTISRN